MNELIAKNKEIQDDCEKINENIENAKKILQLAIPKLGALKEFSAQGALKNAIVTHPELIPQETKEKLAPIIGKYIS